MRHRIGVLLTAAAFAGLAPAPAVLAQDASQTQSFDNRIEALEVAEQGGAIYVRLTLREPLASPPPSFSVANPARIAFDFPGTANALGRNVQTIDQGDLRSANIVQAGDRTRLVLNLTRMSPYEARVQGRDLIIALSPAAARAVQGTVVSEAAANFAAPRSNAAAAGGLAVRDINFRRGTGGEGRVVVDLSNPDTGIDIRQQGGNLVIDFLQAALPEHLRRRSDVTDFATPVTSMTAQQVGDRVRLTVTPNGLWEHNAYQSDNRFVLEVRRVAEDPAKLGGGRSDYKGEKLSLNFQNVDVRSVLQVIADFTDFNIITSDSVQGNLTLRLKDVPWDQAFDIILRARDLDMRKNGNVIWVAPRDELALREKAQNEALADIESLEPLSTESIRLNYHKAREIGDLLSSGGKGDRGFLSKRGKVAFDERTNRIFVTDVSSRLQSVRNLISDVDVAPRQVLIEARIVEANKTFSRDLGVRLGLGKSKPWKINDGGAQIGFGSSTLGGSAGSSGSFRPETATSGADIQNPYGSFALSIFNSSVTRFLNLELQALESDGRGRVVSSPRVLTANQVEALIKQGTQIPIPIPSTQVGGEPTVEYKDAVLSLKVRPSITPDGRIQLSVLVNKDRPDFTNVVLGRPSIDTKSVQTEVTVENGGTLVIGGVYEEQELNGEDRVPVLGELPVLGGLFRTRSTIAEKKELLVFITPRLVSESLTLR
ncbi:type IV pilus secretin family protein [Thauera sp. SWB20]|uniref:type IV pilus secretin family protein n=1 Tax=Thauera sp. SWB20 TaxID=1572758 RepID=UPI0005ADF08F|nr:type IV pilus secretin family protein [Thauera sp. SWB20]KIN89829.1 type IV pilus secretin PilQ family protein [Thauera sp. SWB20]